MKEGKRHIASTPPIIKNDIRQQPQPQHRILLTAVISPIHHPARKTRI